MKEKRSSWIRGNRSIMVLLLLVGMLAAQTSAAMASSGLAVLAERQRRSYSAATLFGEGVFATRTWRSPSGRRCGTTA